MQDAQDSAGGSAVLVTGGSGFIGRHLVRAFAKKGETVISMYHRRLPESATNVYPICSDMSSAELLAAPLRGVDTVIHLAWDRNLIGPPDGYSWDVTSENVPPNILFLKRLILAMERSKTKRMIFVSAVGASRYAQEPFLREKYLAELCIVNSTIPEKVILRSSVVYNGDGASDRFIGSIMRVMKIPGFYPVPRGKHFLAPLHVDDLVKVLSNLSRFRLEQSCSILQLTGGENYRVDEVFKIVSDQYAGGSRLAIRGVLGNVLLNLFERKKSKESPESPRIKHFLALQNEKEEKRTKEDPLSPAVPPRLRSFRQSVEGPKV